MYRIAGVFEPCSLNTADLPVNFSNVASWHEAESVGRWVESGLAVVVTCHKRFLPRAHKRPVLIADRRWVVAGDCDIGNGDDLRQFLKGQGRIVSGTCDLELALHLMEIEGYQGLSRLRGAFALVLWDRTDEVLWLVRDHLGVRPLYHASVCGKHVFASDLRMLRGISNASFTLDPHALASFLGVGVIPHGRSLLAGVQNIGPGCSLRIDRAGVEQLRFDPWWCYLGKHATDAQSIDERIDTAIDRLLPGSETVGIAFSGGIDSTVILQHALARSREVRTFTLVYEGQDDPNAQRARTVASIFGVSLEEVPFRIPRFDEVYECLSHRLTTPAAAPNALHNDALHLSVSGKTSSLIGGQLGDTVLGGEAHYLPLFEHFRCNPLVVVLTDGYEAVLDRRWPPEIILRWPALAQLECWAERSGRFLSSGFSKAVACTLLREQVLSLMREASNAHPLTKVQLVDIILFCHWITLTLGWENGVVHGVDVRTPFADVDLVKAALECGPDRLLDNGVAKAILRRRLRGWLPDELVDVKSIGYGLGYPYRSWLFDNRGGVRSVLDAQKELICAILRPDVVDRLFEEDDLYYSQHLLVWRFFSLAAWYCAHSDIAQPALAVP